MKKTDFASFRPSKQRGWQAGEETGKEHLYYFPSDWDYKKDPKKTLCGKKFSTMTKTQDGWWGGYGAFKHTKKKCKKCERILKKRLEEKNE